MKKIIKSPTKIIVVCLILLIAFGYFRSRNQKNPSVFNAKKSILVTPKIQNIESLLSLSGSIDASSKATLQFQTSGQLAWVGVKAGDKVKKYQAIASLDKTQLRKNLEAQFLAYKSGLATFNDTQDTYKTQKENSTLTDAMKRILDRTQNTLDTSVLNYELADLTIKYATITSPINGIVTEVASALPGTNISALTTTYSIIDPNTVFFKSEIDQEDVNKIINGQEAILTLDSFSDEKINSKINYISFGPINSTTSTVYEVHFTLPIDNSDLKYRLGMTGNVNIPLKKAENVLTVPLEAISENNDQKFIEILNGKKIEKKVVTTGIESDIDVEITSGLNTNDQIIIQKR